MLSGGSLAPRTKRMERGRAHTPTSSPKSINQIQQGTGQLGRSSQGKPEVWRSGFSPNIMANENKQARGGGRESGSGAGVGVRPESAFWFHHLLAV